MDLLKSKGLKQMPQDGIYSVTVPGAVAGWEALRTRFGTMSYPKLLASAISYASEGLPVTEWIAQDWERNATKLAKDPFTRATYLPDQKPPKIGNVFRNPDLAASLHRFQVIEDEIHGLVATREDRVADVCLDPFDDGGFELHDETSDNKHW